MPQRRRVKIHDTHEVIDGQALAALWPSHKPLAEVLKLRATTPEMIWHGTYQGTPTPASGATFRRQWWQGKHRYDATDPAILAGAVLRVLSIDTAYKDKDTSDYTGIGAFALMPDYRLLLIEARQQRLEFPDLPDAIQTEIRRHNHDGRLRAIIIEDTGAGTSSLQTLAVTLPVEESRLLVPFRPTVSKTERAQQAAVWCQNGMVWLPEPSAAVPWLTDFEDQLFTFPSGIHDDMVDAVSQSILYLEHYLATGYQARTR